MAFLKAIPPQHDLHREKRQDLVQGVPNQQEETPREKVRAKSYGPVTRFLIWWGRNPIFLYILHLILLGLVQLPGAAWWYSDASPLLVAFQFTLIMVLLTGIAHLLYKRHIVISL